MRRLTRQDTQSVVNFTYDDNGNLTSGDGLSISYNRDNKPTEILRNNVTSTFNYGADGMRYKQVTSVGGTTTTTYYGKQFERVKQVTGSTTDILDKTFIGGHTILFKAVQGSLGNQKSIIHLLHDRLGGVDIMVDGSRHLDQAGAQENLVEQRRGYDAFGRPRDMQSLDFSLSETSNLLPEWKNVKQGFTSHEHLPESELIHMNGRVYDYNIGRFLSVDPFIQMPVNSQSVNPYSYIMNNPMAGTDPTGYFSKTDKDEFKADAEKPKRESNPCEGTVRKLECHIWKKKNEDKKDKSDDKSSTPSVTIVVSGQTNLQEESPNQVSGAGADTVLPALAGVGVAIKVAPTAGQIVVVGGRVVMFAGRIIIVAGAVAGAFAAGYWAGGKINETWIESSSGDGGGDSAKINMRGASESTTGGPGQEPDDDSRNVEFGKNYRKHVENKHYYGNNKNQHLSMLDPKGTSKVWEQHIKSIARNGRVVKQGTTSTGLETMEVHGTMPRTKGSGNINIGVRMVNRGGKYEINTILTNQKLF